MPGIDLARYHRDVRRLTLARWRGPALALDPDDLVQEVYRRILRRNRRPCAWDPARGSLGHYVHCVAGNAIADMLAAHRRHTRHELHGDPERLDQVAAPSPDPEAALDALRELRQREERSRRQLWLFSAAVLSAPELPSEAPPPAPAPPRVLRERRAQQHDPRQLPLF